MLPPFVSPGNFLSSSFSGFSLPGNEMTWEYAISYSELRQRLHWNTLYLLRRWSWLIVLNLLTKSQFGIRHWLRGVPSFHGHTQKPCTLRDRNFGAPFSFLSCVHATMRLCLHFSTTNWILKSQYISNFRVLLWGKSDNENYQNRLLKHIQSKIYKTMVDIWKLLHDFTQAFDILRGKWWNSNRDTYLTIYPKSLS